MKTAEDEDIAPAIGAAGRLLIAAMMSRIGARGFDGMTPAFASVIPLLDAEGIRPTLLAQRAGISKQAISQLVRELENRGYVEQIPDENDTRAKIIRLTSRGVALRKACFEVRKELQALGTAKLGPVRIARLRKDLLQFSDVLRNVTETGGKED